jgi:excisionase family DNA binding protein
MARDGLQPRSHALRATVHKAEDLSTNDQMLSIPAACRRLGISKTKLYDEIRAHKLISVKIGKRRLISPRAMAAYIRQLEEEAKA